MLVPCLRFRAGSLDDLPLVLLRPDSQPVQVVIIYVIVGLVAGLLAFDTTKHKDAFKVDLLGDQIPLDLREVIDGELLSFMVCNQTHGC